MKKILLLTLFSFGSLLAQNNPNPGYWQQKVDYKMDVSMDVKTYQYKGKQTLVYTNNSPDTLYMCIIICSTMLFSQTVLWMLA